MSNPKRSSHMQQIEVKDQKQTSGKRTNIEINGVSKESKEEKKRQAAEPLYLKRYE